MRAKKLGVIVRSFVENNRYIEWFHVHLAFFRAKNSENPLKMCPKLHLAFIPRIPRTLIVPDFSYV